MKFLIIDFDHYEMLYSLIRVIEKDAEKIVVCTSKAHIQMLEPLYKKASLFHWIEADNTEILFSQRLLFEHIQFNFTFLNTVCSHFHFANKMLDQIKPGKILLTIHDVNFWFRMGTRYKIFKRPRSEDHAIMLQLINKADAILVLSESVKDYLQSYYQPSKLIIIFPYSIYEGVVNKATKEVISIVIPGIIEAGRKDFSFAIDVFKSLPANKFSLTLLGRPKGEYGLAITKKCDQLIAEGYRINYYTGYVDQEEFEKQMTQADMIFAPLSLETSFAGIPEVYGKSKETGALFDMIRYAKPGIVPKALNIPREMVASTLTYANDTQLYSCLNLLTDDSKLKQLKTNAELASQYYSIDNVHKKLFRSLATL